MIAPAQAKDYLIEQYDYAAVNMGIESAAIYTKASRDDLLYEDFDAINKQTLGCVTGSTFAEKFISEYGINNNLNPKLEYYNNTTELGEALLDGKVDAIVTNIMFASPELKLLGWYSPMPVYYITQKGNSDLLASLDEAMLNIMVEEPGFQSELISRYFPIYDSTHVTYLETQYIESMKEINVGYVTNEKPISYTDENGEFKGIVREIMDNISESLGLRFKYIALDKDKINDEYLRDNSIQVIANYGSNKLIGNDTLIKSQGYQELNNVFVTQPGTQIGSMSSFKIATDALGISCVDMLKESYPNAEVKQYESIEDAFEAVDNGQADVVYGERYIIDPYLSKPLYKNMVIVQTKDDIIECSVAVVEQGLSASDNPLISNSMFISIIDKGINQLSDDKINSYILDYTSNNRYEYTLGDFVYQYKAFIIIILLCIVAVIVLLCSVMVTKQRNYKIVADKNEQLAVAIEQANSASAAKGQFLAQMSHEIRTPMNAIIGLTELAKMDINSPDKMKEYLAKVDSSSKLLLGIINDVLDMSAIENSKLKIASAEFDFKQLLSSITTVFYQQSKQKGITFEMKMKGVTEETLVGDSLRVNQILMNLLSNAVKFTPAGGNIGVLVIQSSMSLDAVHIRFVVSDTGCGMSDDLKRRLFSPFEQEDATTARKHGGSGLGLAITKNLIELMGGSIQVESEKNVGSTFTVDVPFKKVKQEEQKRVSVQTFSDIKALVVDDDEESCEYAEVLLERLGVEHNHVTSGEAALELLGEADDAGKPYNIVLVDWKMPDMDGVTVTQQIREIFGDDTIVIIVSAYDLNEVESQGREAGADYFIPKPLFQSSVFNILTRISNKDYDKLEEENTPDKNYDFKGRKVLVAEDVVLNMEVAVRLLNMVGIEVVCAEDGQQAVDIFANSQLNEFDAILLDINMPNKNGYEAATEIRASVRKDAKNVPIYAMTANAFSQDVTAALNSGMNGHIAKPIETDVLYKTLKKAFEERENA